MADAEKVVEKVQTPTPSNLTHVGFGKYKVEGSDTVFLSKAAAVAFSQEQIETLEFQNEFGDVAPVGFEIRDRSLKFRSSVMEVPMNMLYLEDGSFNPMYDRTWFYGWGAQRGTSIATKRAQGYNLVSHDELKQMVDAGKAPPYYLSLLHRDGDMLLYGDAVLIRQPRILWRQRQVQAFEKAMNRIKRTDEEQEAARERLGRPANVNVKNELSIRM